MNNFFFMQGAPLVWACFQFWKAGSHKLFVALKQCKRYIVMGMFNRKRLLSKQKCKRLTNMLIPTNALLTFSSISQTTTSLFNDMLVSKGY
jgi:hypothetical protein